MEAKLPSWFTSRRTSTSASRHLFVTLASRTPSLNGDLALLAVRGAADGYLKAVGRRRVALGEGDGQDTILVASIRVVDVRRLREADGSSHLAVRTLDDVIPGWKAEMRMRGGGGVETRMQG